MIVCYATLLDESWVIHGPPFKTFTITETPAVEPKNADQIICLPTTEFSREIPVAIECCESNQSSAQTKAQQ